MKSIKSNKKLANALMCSGGIVMAVCAIAFIVADYTEHENIKPIVLQCFMLAAAIMDLGAAFRPIRKSEIKYAFTGMVPVWFVLSPMVIGCFFEYFMTPTGIASIVIGVVIVGYALFRYYCKYQRINDLRQRAKLWEKKKTMRKSV